MFKVVLDSPAEIPAREFPFTVRAFFTLGGHVDGFHFAPNPRLFGVPLREDESLRPRRGPPQPPRKTFLNFAFEPGSIDSRISNHDVLEVRPWMSLLFAAQPAQERDGPVRVA